MIDILWRVLETEVIPDAVIRAAIRHICAERLADEARGGVDAEDARARAFLAARRDGPIARHTDAANRQHYEVPPELFEACLGRRMKYSSAYWPAGVETLDAAEEAMLDLTCRRAELADGQEILDLGCGWGALTLWMAEQYPRAKIHAVSNSAPQRRWIERRAPGNVTVVTADVNAFTPPRAFDRIVSVEMFEHMWNHEALMSRLAAALAEGGKLFVHVFAHQRFAYRFEDRGASDWMARTFFTGGWMPSHAAMLRPPRELVVEEDWRLSGMHYARTAEAWLAAFDRRRAALEPILARTYGEAGVARWRLNWRIFFMACAEMFGFRGGEEWIVSHVRYGRRV